MVSQANGPWLSKLPTTRRWEATEVSDVQIWIDWLQLAISLVMLIIRRWWKGLFISSTSPPSLPICLCCKSTFDQGSVARAINRNWHDRPPVAQTNFLAAFLFQHLLVRLLLLCSNSNCSFLRFNNEETVTEVSIQLFPFCFQPHFLIHSTCSMFISVWDSQTSSFLHHLKYNSSLHFVMLIKNVIMQIYFFALLANYSHS